MILIFFDTLINPDSVFSLYQLTPNQSINLEYYYFFYLKWPIQIHFLLVEKMIRNKKIRGKKQIQ